ncbi:DDE-domain-containing protein [Dissoconium aciculare CBS 342.82]|uniref:DDE-domain-containing protein n=1 Tax=Dissoconium aciculare CBS 342.82 TaxID=1314786 RepID=A0A6J3LPB1_9PEZI|nr:DDE-domain-containing protein [Dissoconium aciculare CBS 342.82]KAF1817720.1 DDE-domain-containing protein [Dissoconium aciculare CBS 342.82]
MDETGVMLSKLNSVRVIMDRTNRHGCRGARVKRTTVTAVECMSADGRYLHPMIIWPAATHRANWVTHPTPGWHYAYSDSGYIDSYLSLQWLRLVFDPQTRDRAGQRPRVLICDGFGTHETLDILEFALQHQIILCRLSSHSSHKLQPCDISIFGPLKAAYRDQVERLERGGVGTIGKEHFAKLYCHAPKAGLFPFCPERVLRDLPRSAAPPTLAGSVNGDAAAQPDANIRTWSIPSVPSTPMIPATPVTPVDLAGILTLHDVIRRDVQGLDSGSQRRLQKHVQKLSKAVETSFAEHVLLERRNKFLQRSNSEARVRRSTRSKVIGTARVMSCANLEKARDERALRDARSIAKRRSRTQAVDNNATDKPLNVVQTRSDSLSVQGRYTGPHIEGHEVYRPPTARMW